MEDSSQQEDVLLRFLDAATLHPKDQHGARSLLDQTVASLQNGSYPCKRAAFQSLMACFRSNDLSTEHLLREFVCRASVVEDFVTCFTTFLVAKTTKFASAFASGRFVVLRMSIGLLNQLFVANKDDFVKPKWLAAVITSQSLLLESSLLDKKRLRAKITKELVHLLQMQPKLVPEYVACITESFTQKQDTTHFALWSVLSQVALSQQVHDELFKIYTSWAFESKAKNASVVALEPQDVRFKHLTKQQFEEIIQPTMTRMLKKSPDSVLEAVIEFVKAAPLDFGAYVEDIFVSLMVAKLRSQKDDVREFTVTLVKLLLHKCADPTHFTTILKTLGALLDGKHGILAQFYMREVLFVVLVEASVACKKIIDSSDAQDMAGMVIALLTKAIDKEAHDATRDIGLLALGEWFLIANEATTTKSLQETQLINKIKTGITQTKNETVCVGYLRFIAHVCASNDVKAKCFADILPQLTKIVVESNKKPHLTHVDGLLALCVVTILTVGTAAGDSDDHTKLLATFFDSKSFVETTLRALLSFRSGTHPAVSMKGSDGVEKPEVTALRVTSICLGKLLGSFVATTVPSTTLACKFLVECRCSRHENVRQAAQQSIMNLYASVSLDLAVDFAKCFVWKLVEWCDEEDAERAQIPQQEDQQVQTNTPSASILRQALRGLMPRSTTELLGNEKVVDSLFAFFCFIAHHPCLVNGGKKSAFGKEWKQIKKQFVPSLNPPPKEEEEDEVEAETEEDHVDDLIESHEGLQEALVRLLFNEEESQTTGTEPWVRQGFLFSQNAKQRIAAQRMVASLSEFHGTGASERLMNELLLKAKVFDLLAKENAAISAEDVAVCSVGFDELYDPKQAAKKESETTVPAPASKRGRLGKQRGTEDEQWEEQVRQELAAKKKSQQASPKKKQLTKEQQEQLALQQATRLRVQKTRHHNTCVMELTQLFARSPETREQLHLLAPFLFGAICKSMVDHGKLALFEAQIAAMLLAMAKSVQPPELSVYVGYDLANALLIVLKHEAAKQDGEERTKAHLPYDLLLHVLTPLVEYVCSGFVLQNVTEIDTDLIVNHLSPCTWHLVFPLVRSILHYSGESCADSLELYALWLLYSHARTIPEEEEEEIGDMHAQRLLRKPMIELVLYVLHQAAAESAEHFVANQMLLTLSDGPLFSIGEWTPLLGDGGLLCELAYVRHSCLDALIHVLQDHDEAIDEESGASKKDPTPLHTQSNPLLACRLFSARFDPDEGNREIATHIWELAEAKLPKLFAGALLVLLNHVHDNVRESAASAIAEGIALFPETLAPVLNNLKSQFKKHIPPETSDVDEFGIPKARHRANSRDELEHFEELAQYLPRCGVALCLEKIYKVNSAKISQQHVLDTVDFVIETGLSDLHAQVRNSMRRTGIEIISACGQKPNTTPLLKLVEDFLAKPPPKDNAKLLMIYDHQREGLVVFLGCLAKHMAPTDPKVASIVDKLLEALSIPSESVQRAVANCLAPLIPAVKSKSPELLQLLLEKATTAEMFGERIGAAFGVSAVVKGLGIGALKQHEVIAKLEERMQKGGANGRQGALLVFECLSERLGMLFEPYIIVILPILLKCFADSTTQVREAASHTSKKIMGNLSAHGVKLILPSVLKALDDSQWRTKQAGIQILGSMAYCAPRQLGSCLPQVVPRLTEALTDSHPRVRDASKSALRDIGSVVRNPEIASISVSLLSALEEPNKNTNQALEKLQSTSFVHSIDAPSLALVMPIITRGLRDRTGDSKKKAALIVGSMCSMINDAKDLIPYMEMVLPSLKTQLMDPIPEVRSVASKAMGKLVKGLGESHFVEIFAWLLEAIKGDYGSVERSGAAQGLCEVLVALGNERLEQTLFEEIFPLARHPKYSVREGVLWIIAFLPASLGKGFSVFLTEALPIIVSGLSDEAESVREVAMYAGHVVVNAHALSHTREILPSLEAGLEDDNWRIRQSSVALLGDLMYRISGTRAVGLSNESTGEVDEEDDSAGSAAGDKAITQILGLERRNAILASLYMIRSDTSAVVRQSALQVWKSIVPNTPKTLRQILETLMRVIVTALSGQNVEKQTMAGRSLGEIVRKLGEHVLPEVVPILRSGLDPKNPSGKRHGVCIGLAEVIECSNKKHLEEYVTTIVQAVLDGLCDEVEEVRSAAAQAFDALQRGIGYRSIDETVPALLERIRRDEVHALNGLQEMLRVKSKEVLPYLIPRLVVKPLTLTSIHSISRVAQATGSVIHFQMEKLMHFLVGEYTELYEENQKSGDEQHKRIEMDSIRACLRDIVLSVEEVGVHWCAIEICKYCESESPIERELGLFLIAEFCSATKTTYKDQLPLFLKQIVLRMNDADAKVVMASSEALKGVNVTTRPEQLANQLDFIRQSINTVVSDARHRKGGVGVEGEFLLPSLCLPKGLEPFLPSYQFALMNGKPELRQSAASGLGELVMLTSPGTLRPYLIKLTGPLIRIAGERFPPHVKAAILDTLEILLRKGGVALKPFLPQLQTTFVKALNDTDVEVRYKGSSALGELVKLSPRIDPLVAELSDKIKTTSGGVQQANLEAIECVLREAGGKLSSAVRETLEQDIESVLEESEEITRDLASKCVAKLVLCETDDNQAMANLKEFTLDGLSSWAVPRKQSAAKVLQTVLQTAPSWLSTNGDNRAQLLAGVLELAQDETISVKKSAVLALAELVKLDEGIFDQCLPVICQGIAHANKDICKSSVKMAKRVAKHSPATTRSHLNALVVPLFNLIKGNNIAVKNTAERALLYLLEVHTRPETMAEFVRSCSDAMTGKMLAEYARRVLSKLRLDSGEDSD